MTLRLRNSLSSEQISTTGPKRSNRFLLRSNSLTLGHTWPMDGCGPFSASAGSEAPATWTPSRMTNCSSSSWACWRRIFSKPTSSATLPEKKIFLGWAWPSVGSPAYLSWRADRKDWGGSGVRVGRTKDAAVGDLEWPGYD